MARQRSLGRDRAGVNVADAARLLAEVWGPLIARRERQAAYLALIGGLLRAKAGADDVRRLVERLAELTGDEEADKRAAAVDDTAARMDHDDAVCGWPTLLELLGAAAEPAVEGVKKAFGLPHVVAIYDYTDEAGCLRFQVVRLSDKAFYQRRPDGKGGWINNLGALPRLLYRLPELHRDMAENPDAFVYIPEGEKDVDAVRALGLIAVCNPGGAGKWKAYYNEALRGRRVVVLPDNDDAGRGHARQVGQHLQGVAASVQLLELPDLPQGGDVSDWLAAGGTAEELLRLAHSAPPFWSGADTAGPAEARGPDLPAEAPWPQPLADDAFHGLAGDVVRVLEPCSEADQAALLLQLLVGFGNLLGRTAYWRAEGDQHFGNEFLVLAGQTSKARKGTSWGRVRRLLQAACPDWATDGFHGGLSSGEGLIWAVRDAVYKTVRGEETCVDPGVEDKRLLVVEPEFAGVLKNVERRGNTLSVVVRQCWETGDLATMTKNNPATATGAHISVIAHSTIDEVRRSLSETETSNGFGNRFMWGCAKRSKELPEGGDPDADALADLHRRLSAALVLGQARHELRRNEEARKLWYEVYGPLSRVGPGLTGALLARGESHVMRLAMLYAVLDGAAEMDEKHLMAALAVWEYCEQSVRHIFGDRLGDPVADEILRLLRGSPEGVTRNELREFFHRNVASERIGRALALLLQHRLAYCRHCPTERRPAERWFAATNPAGPP
jgi:hypothetical protein